MDAELKNCIHNEQRGLIEASQSKLIADAILSMITFRALCVNNCPGN